MSNTPTSDPGTPAKRFRIGVEGETVFPTETGRITVILGVNGSGKSSLLNKLAEHPLVDGQIRELVNVEGGRAVSYNRKLWMD